jgi:hypothetical protein
MKFSLAEKDESAYMSMSVWSEKKKEEKRKKKTQYTFTHKHTHTKQTPLGSRLGCQRIYLA